MFLIFSFTVNQDRDWGEKKNIDWVKGGER